MTGRLLVVGASSGIGRAVAVAALGAGWSVAGAARRTDEVAATGAVVLPADVRRPPDCARIVADAAGALGGLDAVVYAAGVARLASVAETDADAWDDMLRTNLLGAVHVVTAALPHLTASSGCAVLLSSHSVPHPWPGLIPYAATKAAVETLVRGWHAECPTVRFATVPVAPTATGFADGWPEAAMADYFARWQAAGYLTPDVATAETTANGVLALVIRLLRR